MATTRSAEEMKRHYVDVMGEPLGTVFNALWQEIASLYWKWGEFVELFGSKESRVTLLNDAAPAFFRMVQDVLWEDTLLHIARMTDSQFSLGKANLTIQRLPGLVANPAAAEEVERLVRVAIEACWFCRDWRNRHLAHRDLGMSLGEPAVPLAEASRAKVKAALNAIADVLNSVASHYGESGTAFSMVSRHGGALSLLNVVDEGVRFQAGRRERALRGELLPHERGPRDL